MKCCGSDGRRPPDEGRPIVTLTLQAAGRDNFHAVMDRIAGSFVMTPLALAG